MAYWLGVGAANLMAAFDPEVIVVGGGVSAAGELLLEPARARWRPAWSGRRLPRPAGASVGAELGRSPEWSGVADLARTRRPDQARR